jgi:hypothetical protein
MTVYQILVRFGAELVIYASAVYLLIFVLFLDPSKQTDCFGSRLFDECFGTAQALLQQFPDSPYQNARTTMRMFSLAGLVILGFYLAVIILILSCVKHLGVFIAYLQ